MDESGRGSSDFASVHGFQADRQRQNRESEQMLRRLSADRRLPDSAHVSELATLTT